MGCEDIMFPASNKWCRRECRWTEAPLALTAAARGGSVNKVSLGGNDGDAMHKVERLKNQSRVDRASELPEINWELVVMRVRLGKRCYTKVVADRALATRSKLDSVIAALDAALQRAPATDAQCSAARTVLQRHRSAKTNTSMLPCKQSRTAAAKTLRLACNTHLLTQQEMRRERGCEMTQSTQ